MDSLSSMARAISEACRDGERLPGALILCGVIEAAAALWLAIFKEPMGIFLHHGKVLSYLYYSILIAVVLFGLVEASFGFWVSGDLDNRRAMGKKILWFSVLPIIFVAALGGFAFAVPK